MHEGPTPEKRLALQTYLRALGIGLSISDDPRPAEMQSVAEATRDRPDAAQIHQMLLRSMQQAVYTPINSGHFGLSFDAYTHFTSPIRRYPDLLVHRVIKALLGQKTYRFVPSALRMPPQPRRSLAAKAAPQLARVLDKQAQAWQAAGLHTSASERRADEASRDVEAWLKCRFMKGRLGEEFQGTVTSVVGFGLFVTLDELHVEGLVHVTELGGEYFRFDELRQELRGDRSGMRYGVGTRVRVQVSRVDLDGRRIDFRMVKELAAPARSSSRPRIGWSRPLPASHGWRRRRPASRPTVSKGWARPKPPRPASAVGVEVLFRRPRRNSRGQDTNRPMSSTRSEARSALLAPWWSAAKPCMWAASHAIR